MTKGQKAMATAFMYPEEDKRGRGNKGKAPAIAPQPLFCGVHIAALGSVGEPATIAGRVAFWGQLHPRLARLSNLVSPDDQGKIIGSIHARIPMVTIDEQRALQRENAEADERLWSPGFKR